MLYFKTRIRRHARGLLFRHGDFRRLLKPGVYRRTRWLGHSIEVVDTMETRFDHKLLYVLVQHPELRAALEVVDLKDHERALVWRDGRLAYILGGGRFAFWKEPAKLEIERFDADDFRFEHRRLEAVLNLPGAQRFFEYVRVEPHQRVLLFREGQLSAVLEPGRHVYWKQAGHIAQRVIDLREQLTEVSGQEIMTADKVTLRVTLIVTYQVNDVVLAATKVADYAQALYREAQLGLRAAIGTRQLDALLGDKETVGNELRNVLQRRVAEFGLIVRSVGLRDIILPGDMKYILNQVLAAEKQAQANLIKRREETAAARSQANTAKLLAENPTLARIKELELLAEVLAGTKSTFLFGSGDVADQIRSLLRKEPADGG